MAIVTEQPASNGSTRYRALQHVRGLRQRGIMVDVLVPPEPPVRRAGRAGQLAFFTVQGTDYVRRCIQLASLAGRYEAVLVQRGAHPLGPAAVIDALARSARRIVFDLDDAVFHTAPDLLAKGRAARWLYGPQQTLRLLEVADAVVCSTPELAAALPGRAADVILPTIPDITGYPTVAHRDELPIRLGWVGSAGGIAYLDPLVNVLDALRRDGVAELLVVAPRPWRGPASFKPWRREDDPAMFGAFDVGLMPLPDTPYTRGKAGFKLLQYMAAGAAVVASPVGINRDLVDASDAGLLAEDPAAWDRALRQLATDSLGRRRHGEAGKRFMSTYADLDAQTEVLAELLLG